MPVVHCKKEAYDVYIGRGRDPKTGEYPTIAWGNPWSHKDGTAAREKVATVEEAVEAFRQDLWLRIQMGETSLAALAELHGKTLGCWCKPGPCHGDVLAAAAAWANEQLLARQVAQIATVPKNICAKCGAATRCNVRGTWLCTPCARREMS